LYILHDVKTGVHTPQNCTCKDFIL